MENNDGSLDLADLEFTGAPEDFVPVLVSPDEDVLDKDDDSNG